MSCRLRSQVLAGKSNIPWDEIDMYSLEDLDYYASCIGIVLKKTVSGPYLKLEAYERGEDKPSGYLTGFVRPFTGILQLETIQVRNRRQVLGYRPIPQGVENKGISFILGCYSLRWAFAKGCYKAELLAVRDTPVMEAILIRLYESYGYKVKATIEEGNLADRIVWGAVGTLMEINIVEFLKEWTPKLRQMTFDAQNLESKKCKKEI